MGGTTAGWREERSEATEGRHGAAARRRIGECGGEPMWRVKVTSDPWRGQVRRARQKETER